MKKHETLIFKAVSGRKYAADDTLIEYLLKNGADPNIKTRSGSNAFHYAIATKDLQLIKYFLAYDVDVNAQDELDETNLELEKLILATKH